MLNKLIHICLKNKLIVLLATSGIVFFGLYALTKISIGAVPDITNNQVQVITTSRNLSTQDVEQFITYPVELEMANLPGVKEIRSVSKFGLSVVTIVFDDEMGTYLPRQLITEKIEAVKEQIPEGFGTPSLGPISTGLGEVYQYILDVETGYENRYSITELRTIQDWIVRRQLSGIPGVVEINTWGGYLKQYEVAIVASKLDALNISISEIYNALEKNNSVAGGGYIEKDNKAYYIRGEGLVKDIQDIENIVVKNDGQPIYIKDIAEVGFGAATRFGAITGNGEGEKVLGQIMMIKNGNAKSVIDAVSTRVEDIQKTLPEGVYINCFLERGELIGKTTFTISENLILGALIVIFVVVLLLGNWRSGLIVASVIPISLLFAISLMYLFGVNANLMSLGAIDFGIIIDGAVIIVEFITYKITRNYKDLEGYSKKGLKLKIDEITFSGASKMMNSAIFGQLIILIVFIPILSLKGVEGKMFTPMALTFSFALIGAMLLCLTYVPVVSSLILKPTKPSTKSIPYKLIAFINSFYEPSILWALRQKKIVLGLSIALLVGSGVLFAKMGAEFVPTLDEGDFVIQPVLPTGLSLGKTIETTTKIEQILLDNFPEVSQVVTRIGAAEIPTDPMSMEETDVIIKLKPKDTWASAESKDELAEKFKEAIQEEMPDVEIEFTQPIEMRFNELITGVRADVAIKLFGEDLNILADKAEEIKDLISGVEGASDIVVEKTEGLPQMLVTFDRQKIARYGLNIADLNRVVAMGFAGEAVGSVFEGEKRFDLVLRFNKSERKSIENLKYLWVDTPSGQKIPLNELAKIEYTTGPAKISRDNTKRRTVVGVNVRDRDLQSVVNDIQQILDNKLTLPSGYLVTYGGQFENLNQAKSRLLIAVPIALFLIFILLFFAFGSIKDVLIVYSAIPLSAVGGILLLWLRGMPFSISAGIGFIALFGIAVLNGIVLIEHFKDLKSKGFANIQQLVVEGAKDRLRPVLLTASAAALGFLPMAISTNAGAEVQRPLATVVVGGLITATILTLIVLPVLYSWFHDFKFKLLKPKTTLSILLIGSSALSFAQQPQQRSVEEVYALALEHNSSIKASELYVDKSKTAISTVAFFDKTSVYYGYDENNLAVNDRPISVFGVAQDFKFPTNYFAERKVKKQEYQVELSKYQLAIQGLKRDVYAAYYQLNYHEVKAEIYKFLDSLYSDFSYSAKRRFELGDTNYLERITAQSKQRKISTSYKQALLEVRYSQEQLKKLTFVDSISITTGNQPLEELALKPLEVNNHIGTAYLGTMVDLEKSKTNLERHKLLPDLSAEYFQGSNNGLNQNLIGYQFGLKIPLLFNGQRKKIKEAQLNYEAMEQEQTAYKTNLEAKYNSLMAQLQQYKEAMNYYNTEGKALAEQIITTANRSYKEGEIDFFQYIQSIESAENLQLDYLEQLNNYNQTLIQLNYLML